MEKQEEQGSQRRRAPMSMPLDKRIQRSYKGKLIKQRIERNKHSNIKRKYFKMLENDAQPQDAKTSSVQEATANEDSSSNDHEAGSESNTKHRKRPHVADTQSKGKHAPRANPFKAVLKEKELVQQTRDTERRKREEEIKQASRRRAKYLRDRKQQRKQLSARTSRGQPIMSNQISNLLTKIRKSA
ncbi:hypothetical protein EV175_002409 [Coemansia sp. RSA 1933]|nr:hypothetical protein EV175_002409 [Coemansia sp. RSA 1933]